MKDGSYSEWEYRDFLDLHSQSPECCSPAIKENGNIK